MTRTPLAELRGADALEFATTRLREVRRNAETWEIEYVDDTTGDHWILDYPQSGEHGGGVPRLARRTLPGP